MGGGHRAGKSLRRRCARYPLASRPCATVQAPVQQPAGAGNHSCPRSLCSAAQKRSASASDPGGRQPLVAVPSRPTAQVFIYVCTVFIWSFFPLAFLAAYLRPRHMLANESLVCFANFTAKARAPQLGLRAASWVTAARAPAFGRLLRVGQRAARRWGAVEQFSRLFRSPLPAHVPRAASRRCSSAPASCTAT